MGWRADEAYDREQQKAFAEWKASLPWREYWAWRWNRSKHFLAGFTTALIALSAARWLLD